MRSFPAYNLDKVLQTGYFEVHRLWDIANELRFRDLKHLTLVLDFQQATEPYRKEIDSWIESKRPREIPQKSDIPKEVLEKFKEMFNNG